MNQALGLYQLLLALGFLLLARHTWRNSSLPAKSFPVLMIAVAFWAAGYGAQLLLAPSGAALAYAGFTFKMIGLHTSSLLLFMFATLYVGPRLEANRFMWLAAPFCLVSLAPMFNVSNGWYATGFMLRGLELQFTPRVLMQFGLAYNLVFLGAALVLLLFRTAKVAVVYQRPAVVMALAWSVPFILAMLTNAGSSGLDWASVSLVLPLVGSLVVVRWQFLQRSPAAYAEALEQIPDVLVVTNASGMIIEQNKAAARVLGLAVGELYPMSDNPEETRDSSIYAVKSEVFAALDTSATAWLWRDITPLKKVQAELDKQATTDYLTKIPNFYKLSLDLQKIQDFRVARAVLLLDLQHFSSLNRRYGVQEANQVLVEFAKWLTAWFSDCGARVYRHNGDKFCVLLEQNLAEAQRLAVACQADLTNKKFLKKALLCRIGVAATPEQHSSRLLEYAEGALQEAKNTQISVLVAPRVYQSGRGLV